MKKLKIKICKKKCVPNAAKKIGKTKSKKIVKKIL